MVSCGQWSTLKLESVEISFENEEANSSALFDHLGLYTHHTSSLRSQLFHSPKYPVRFGNPKLCSLLDQVCPKWESEHNRDEDGCSRCHNTTRNQHHLQPKCDHHLFVIRQFSRWDNSWRSLSPQVASVDLVDSGFSLWNPYCFSIGLKRGNPYNNFLLTKCQCQISV